jgi:UDP-N-acetylmuramoyl-tripeptide--D-alanyl-D-alanine ligase
MNTLYELYLQHPCITTDSRDCPQGSIFIALHGDRFDGNQFALQALEKGCSYAIVDDPAVLDSCRVDRASSTVTDSDRLILVPDTLQAYKELAREHRRQFDIPVIAITGTNGKTTTKELVRAVLAEKYNVLATEANFNNDVGVPKTLLKLTKEHQIAIIEMGASHPGDIKTLVETAEPTCGIITNVGRAHLKGFGSFEGVMKTKGELYDYLRTREDGLVFVNADNDYLLDMLDEEDSKLWITPYSTDTDKQYTCISGEIIHEEGNPLLKMRWRRPIMDLEQTGASQKWHKVQTQLIGDYNIDNVMAAIAVGINFGVDRKQICHALESYKPTNNRSQLIDTQHNRLIVDAYNANPSSMFAALQNFFSIKAADGQEKMTILGDMLELGEDSLQEHQKIVDIIEAAGIKHVWLVGSEFAATNTHFTKFSSVDEVKSHLQAHCPHDRLILIKGSNGTRLYQLPPML